MKELKQLIDSKQWIEAKRYIIENRDRIEEIADALLDAISSYNPEVRGIEYGPAMFDGVEVEGQKGSDWCYMSLDENGEVVFTKQKPFHYSGQLSEKPTWCGDDLQFKQEYEGDFGTDNTKRDLDLDISASNYGLTRAAGETNEDFRKRLTIAIDEKNNKDIERHLKEIRDRNGALSGSKQSIINALMELETVVHTEIIEESDGHFRPMVHITDMSQIEKISMAIGENRPDHCRSYGSYTVQYLSSRGDYKTESFDFVLTNSL